MFPFCFIQSSLCFYCSDSKWSLHKWQGQSQDMGRQTQLEEESKWSSSWFHKRVVICSGHNALPRHSRSFYSQNNLMDNDTGQCQDLQHQQEFLEIFKHFFPHSITTSSSILSSFSGHVVKYLELFPFDWITVSKERWHSSDNLDFKRSN